MAIKVIVVDDHTVVRNSICIMLESHDNISVIGECSDGLEVVRMVRQVQADIVIMDTSCLLYTSDAADE